MGGANGWNVVWKEDRTEMFSIVRKLWKEWCSIGRCWLCLLFHSNHVIHHRQRCAHTYHSFNSDPFSASQQDSDSEDIPAFLEAKNVPDGVSCSAMQFRIARNCLQSKSLWLLHVCKDNTFLMAPGTLAVCTIACVSVNKKVKHEHGGPWSEIIESHQQFQLKLPNWQVQHVHTDLLLVWVPLGWGHWNSDRWADLLMQDTSALYVSSYHAKRD